MARSARVASSPRDESSGQVKIQGDGDKRYGDQELTFTVRSLFDVMRCCAAHASLIQAGRHKKCTDEVEEQWHGDSSRPEEH